MVRSWLAEVTGGNEAIKTRDSTIRLIEGSGDKKKRLAEIGYYVLRTVYERV